MLLVLSQHHHKHTYLLFWLEKSTFPCCCTREGWLLDVHKL